MNNGFCPPVKRNPPAGYDRIFSPLQAEKETIKEYREECGYIYRLSNRHVRNMPVF